MSVRILVGHVIDRLRELPDESVHCCVTSPPYFGLRSYQTPPQTWPDGWVGDLGLEPSPDLFIEHLVHVFREVRRVLRADGTLWLNMGDSFANDGKWGGETGGKQHYLGEANRKRVGREKRITGLKPKDLMLMPARVAIALQEDGWWVRSDIIWAKKSPMPESVTDRPTSAHEHVFLLTRSERYFYDAEAVKEESITGDARRPYTSAGAWAIDGRPAEQRHGGKPRDIAPDAASKRNMRNVWHLGPEPFPEAHFATFPSEIPRRAILAGTSAHGVCAECGAPWARVVEKDQRKFRAVAGDTHDQARLGGDGRTGRRVDVLPETKTLGWAPTCGCNAAVRSAIVLDPFFGAGTTGLVADQLGRDCIGIELNPDYARMAENRLRRDAGLFADIAAD